MRCNNDRYIITLILILISASTAIASAVSFLLYIYIYIYLFILFQFPIFSLLLFSSSPHPLFIRLSIILSTSFTISLVYYLPSSYSIPFNSSP
ncbi:hypothetical protein J3Q64DRAFT_1760553 [Phycomyces blakesleeanus]|uniref:Uncharacterized protein n=1 Tax=Phycomyces blakesleeanus TaxID=4837 RepID=A0ABR3APQ4_PHYBL